MKPDKAAWEIILTGLCAIWPILNCMQKAKENGTDIHGYLTGRASLLRPGQSGLVALDWWNGNRSVLVDADLTGMMLGYDASNQAGRNLYGVDGSNGLRYPHDY